ncbi:helix-turn-helix domain-containing protein [Bacillus norwichensis]|uniref:Helix-turn-helix transcriptional regulator n=1 Tax=Bacillus norwichensis TaxID=2762217 RepID=A0ABR8VG92_9BACI|nr:helix-turn-helix transcriptional regulator [Bacillus norwichensis]MBD8003769.1 helix-turn-helix transcriptional regulator [Bacillus norwichensis]
MGVRYEKLFHLLHERNMTTRELEKQAGYSGNITTRMRRNEYISLESVEKICLTLGCRVDDILEFDK